MDALRETEELLSRLTRAEKAQVLQRVVRIWEMLSLA